MSGIWKLGIVVLVAVAVACSAEAQELEPSEIYEPMLTGLVAKQFAYS